MVADPRGMGDVAMKQVATVCGCTERYARKFGWGSLCGVASSGRRCYKRAIGIEVFGMKSVRLEFKGGEYRLVVNGTNEIVSRSTDRKECMAFLANNEDYGYSAPRRKDAHYAV